MPAVLLKFHAMHVKAMQVPTQPGLLLEHYRTEGQVTMSLPISCLQSKYTAHSVNSYFIITLLKRNSKHAPGLGQVQCHITQARTYTHEHANTQQLQGCPLEARLTLILLTWTIWRPPTNASKWRVGFNSAFKGLNTVR